MLKPPAAAGLAAPPTVFEAMADDADNWVPVATIIPRRLHREAKGYCKARTMTLMAFVAEAVEEKLRTERALARRRRSLRRHSPGGA